MSDFLDETKVGEQWDISKIKPYEKNAKKHPIEQIEKLAKTIKENGWRSRISIDAHGVIIAGHGRFEAAKHLNLKTVPVSVIRDLSEEKIKALRLLDNHVVSNEYDTALLTDELASLINEDEMDLSWAFSEKEISFALDDQGEVSLGALTDSIADDLSDYQEATNEDVKAVDESEVSISKVFSFSKVSGYQARQLNLLEKYAEGETGLEGAEAISKFIEEMMSEAA